MRALRRRTLRVVLVILLAVPVPVLLLGSARAGADDPVYGDSGSQVRAIQNRLIAAGYLRAQHNGGNFGRLTRDALRRVQRDYGLTPTGRYGPRTREALGRAAVPRVVRVVDALPLRGIGKPDRDAIVRLLTTVNPSRPAV